MRPSSVLFLALAGLVGIAVIFAVPQAYGPNLVVEQATARVEQPEGQGRISIARFLFRNRGYTAATKVRLRTLTAEINRPGSLIMVDDFELAHSLEPDLSLMRRIIFRGPPPPAEGPRPPVRLQMALVIVADYGNKNMLVGGDKQKRWYYVYTLGDNQAYQAGTSLRDRFMPYVDGVLNPPEEAPAEPAEPAEPDPNLDQG